MSGDDVMSSEPLTHLRQAVSPIPVSWPGLAGLARPSTTGDAEAKIDVDGRHKAGHDTWDATPDTTYARTRP
jgi:hypothetical protein